MKTLDTKAAKRHKHQNLDKGIERVLSAHIIHSSNTFASIPLNPSLSPFRNAGLLSETSKQHFPLPAKASRFTEPIRRHKSNHMISR